MRQGLTQILPARIFIKMERVSLFRNILVTSAIKHESLTVAGTSAGRLPLAVCDPAVAANGTIMLMMIVNDDYDNTVR